MSTYSKEQVVGLLKEYEKDLTYDDWIYTMQKINIKIKQLDAEENPKIKKLTIKLNTYISKYGEGSKQVLKAKNKIDKQKNKLLYG